MQQKVKTFNLNKKVHKTPMPIYARLLNIQSELGELTKEYLANSKYGTKDFELKPEFKMEYGDVLYCLLSLGNELGIDAEKCLDATLKKLQDRMDNNQSMGSR